MTKTDPMVRTPDPIRFRTLPGQLRGGALHPDPRTGSQDPPPGIRWYFLSLHRPLPPFGGDDELDAVPAGDGLAQAAAYAKPVFDDVAQSFGTAGAQHVPPLVTVRTPPNDAPRAPRTSWPSAGGGGRASPPSRPHVNGCQHMYLTAGPSDPRPMLPTDSPAAPAAACPGWPRRFPLPGRNNPVGDQTLPDPLVVVRRGRHQSGDRRPSIKDLNLTATAHHAQIAGEIRLQVGDGCGSHRDQYGLRSGTIQVSNRVLRLMTSRPSEAVLLPAEEGPRTEWRRSRPCPRRMVPIDEEAGVPDRASRPSRDDRSRSAERRGVGARDDCGRSVP